jgi:DNA-directed RNA polymerase specialized sigma24 family protein
MDTVGSEHLLEHWSALVRVTQALVDSREDAEDCASSAVLQLLERSGDTVDNEQAFLVTVAKRRAVDRARSQARARIRDGRLAGQQQHGAVDVAEDVAARAEARWVDRTARAVLSAKAYRLLRLLADGHEVAAAAAELGMTQRAAESLLLRSRRTVRRAWAKTLAVLGGCLASLRRSGPAAGPAAALAAAVVLVAVGPAVWRAPSAGASPAAPTTRAVYVSSDLAETRPVPAPRAAHAPGPPSRAGAPVRAADQPPVRTLMSVPQPMGGHARITRKTRGDGPPAGPVGTIVECVRDFTVSNTHVGC